MIVYAESTSSSRRLELQPPNKQPCQYSSQSRQTTVAEPHMAGHLRKALSLAAISPHIRANQMHCEGVASAVASAETETLRRSIGQPCFFRSRTVLRLDRMQAARSTASALLEPSATSSDKLDESHQTKPAAVRTRQAVSSAKSSTRE